MATFKLPDGSFVRGVNAHANKEEILREAISQRVTTPDQAAIWLGRNVDSTPGDLPSVGEAALIGAGRGLLNVGEGLVQTGLTAASALEGLTGFQPFGFSPTEVRDEFNRRAQEERDFFRRTQLGETPFAQAMETAGETAAMMAAPAIGGRNATRRIAGEGLVGGLLGASEFVEPGESRAVNATLGLLGGLVPQAAVEQVPRVVNTVKNKLADPAQQAISDIAQQFDVPLFQADVGSRPAAAVAQLAEEIPVLGTAQRRLKQAHAARRAAENLTDRYLMEFDAASTKTKASLNDIRRVAGNNAHPRQARARAVLEQIDGMDDDFGRAVLASANLEGLRRKLRADSMFDEASTLFGDATVVPGTALRTLDELIDNFQRSNSGLRKKFAAPLVEIRENLGGDIGYQGLRDLRTDLGKMVDATSLEQRELKAALVKAKVAVDEDLKALAKVAGPSAEKAYLRADKFFKEKVVPYNQSQVVKTLGSDEDVVISQFIKAGGLLKGHGVQAQRYFNLLDDTGKAAVRAHIMQAALDRALARQSEIQGVFSTGNFAKVLEDLDAPKNVFFKGRGKEELDGFVNLMRAVQRAGQVSENPPTGVRAARLLTIGVMGGIGVTGGIGSATSLSIGLGALLTKGLFATDPGRRLLQAASKQRSDKALIRLLEEKGDQVFSRYAINRALSLNDQEEQ